MDFLIEKFLNNPSYLDNGAGFLADRWHVKKEKVVEARKRARAILAEQVEVDRPFRRMFFDIETSPCLGWFWRPSFKTRLDYGNVLQDAAVICVSWKFEDEDTVYHLTWDDGWDDKLLLMKFVEEVNKADEVIAHNGDRFDIKWLRTRCLFHGIDFPTVVKTLDTLQKAKYYFNFPSNRLNDIGQYLKVGEKIKTEPGLWRKTCFENDRESLLKMVEYCDQDVVLLEDIYKKLASYADSNTHVGVHAGKPRWTCPRDGSEDVQFVKSIITKSGTIQRLMRCNKCGHVYKISNTAYKEYATR